MFVLLSFHSPFTVRKRLLRHQRSRRRRLLRCRQSRQYLQRRQALRHPNNRRRPRGTFLMEILKEQNMRVFLNPFSYTVTSPREYQAFLQGEFICDIIWNSKGYTSSLIHFFLLYALPTKSDVPTEEPSDSPSQAPTTSPRYVLIIGARQVQQKVKTASQPILDCV